MEQTQSQSQKKPQLFAVLKNYKALIGLLILLTVASNGLNLVIPKLVSRGIDAYITQSLVMNRLVAEFLVIAGIIFVLSYIQSLVQAYASEKVARDLRTTLAGKISERSFLQLQQETPAKLLTNLTSDVNQVKMFVSMAVVTIVSSLFLIVGASVLLLTINWKLALAVLAILPLIAIVFMTVFSRMKPLFTKTQEIIDVLNKTINESILGAALIRVLNSQIPEYNKFIDINSQARNTGLQITKIFSAVIPIVSVIANAAMLIILLLGGHYVINGTMSLGDFTAFNTYVMILIFPLIMIGFMSNIISGAQASYVRIYDTLTMPEVKDEGTVTSSIKGNIEAKNIELSYGEKTVLKNISFTINAGSKTAIIGPTAAGKTQLLNLLMGLIKPSQGQIVFDGTSIEDYNRDTLHKQVGIVFQDSVMFNLSIKENIAFSSDVSAEDLEKAIQTAELKDFIQTLPEKLDTVVSERGTSLSGGQKQRVMLARALAINPSVLLLDDFTARVDTKTEQKILQNIAQNYPDLTLISVTQKITSVDQFDHIIVLMEGEILAQGKHEHLMHTSPEYVQIYNSQQSTNAYELQA